MTNETWAGTETKVQLFNSKLKLIADSREIECAHRNREFRGDAGRPRPVVVKFIHSKDKQLIMTKAIELTSRTLQCI